MNNIYFIPWKNKNKLSDLLKKAGIQSIAEPGDLTAIKTHMGESGGIGFIEPHFIKTVADEIKNCKANPFVTDTNTIYTGKRANAVDHLTLANEHGFSTQTLGAPVMIADGLKGLDSIEVKIDGEHFKKVKIASNIYNSNSMIVTSHFKGHILGGFGGAIKNLGMGCGTRMGKFEMHSGLSPVWDSSNCIACGLCVKACAHSALTLTNKTIDINKDKCVGCGECIAVCRYGALNLSWDSSSKEVQEKFAEYALGAVKDKRVLYINFLNHITKNCDCMGWKEKALCEDIGILAGTDPVAVDKASYDLVVKQNGDIFKKAHPTVDCMSQIRHAEKIKLGSSKYTLNTVDHSSSIDKSI